MKFKDNLVTENDGGKNYISLKDKEEVSGIFAGEPYEYYAIWDNGKQIEVDEGYRGAKMRFRINFIVKEGPSYVAKVFENSSTVYGQLAELHKEYDLTSVIVKIKRNGIGLETSYSILPLIKQTITPELKDFLSKVTLNKLSKDKQLVNHAPDFGSEDVPF